MKKYRDFEIVLVILIVKVLISDCKLTHICCSKVPVDGPGLYTGPVFTAASTGPLFST